MIAWESLSEQSGAAERRDVARYLLALVSAVFGAGAEKPADGVAKVGR